MRYLIFFIALLISSGLAFAGPLETLQPGHWLEIPNSQIAPLCPSPSPPGSIGCAGVISAWVGASYDTTRHNYIISGGGHGDYAGNEIYFFNTDTLQWSRAWGPSANSDIPPLSPKPTSQCPGFAGQQTWEVYFDCKPASRHPYSGQIYLPPPVDRFWFHGGSLWSGSGGFGLETWTFNFANSTFNRLASITACYAGPSVPFAVYDPVNGKIYAHKYNSVCQYDPATDSWQKRGGFGAGISPNAGASFDPVRRKMYLIGGGAVRFYDLNNANTNNQLQTMAVSGAIEIKDKNYPGCDYHAASDKIVCWYNGSEVYELDSNSGQITKILAASTNTAAPPPLPASGGGSGVHTRWRWISDKGVFLIVNSIHQNVFAYKPFIVGPPVQLPAGATNLGVQWQ